MKVKIRFMTVNFYKNQRNNFNMTVEIKLNYFGRKEFY